MEKIIKSFFTVIVLLVMTLSVQAQKYGYINSALILSEMPEVKAMDSNLKALEAQLKKKGQNKVADFRKREEEAVRKKERGEMSPLEEKNTLEALKKEQEEILKLEQVMQKQLVDKRNELLEPIYEKINKAIEEVAKENGLAMIFEQNILLYSDESLNMNDEVKAKL